MKIYIYDYAKTSKEVELKDVENITRIEIDVLSWDEVLRVERKWWKRESYDSSSTRLMSFQDDYYLIYNIVDDRKEVLENWIKERTKDRNPIF